ncbi:hypothetical protein TNCV_4549811 [Trichonephila clavipes]|nr:hypothetical protein TNCV_4549811 [Trichonephila clavipes]
MATDLTRRCREAISSAQKKTFLPEGSTVRLLVKGGNTTEVKDGVEQKQDCHKTRRRKYYKPGPSGGQSVCPPNEEVVECINFCNTCEDGDTCYGEECLPGCDCLPGYLRNDEGECIPRGLCPLPEEEETDYSGAWLDQVGIMLTADESRFQLCAKDHRRRVWRPPEQRADPAFTIKRYTDPQPGVMARGATFLTTRPLWSPLETHLQRNGKSTTF